MVLLLGRRGARGLTGEVAQHYHRPTAVPAKDCHYQKGDIPLFGTRQKQVGGPDRAGLLGMKQMERTCTLTCLASDSVHNRNPISLRFGVRFTLERAGGQVAGAAEAAGDEGLAS